MKRTTILAVASLFVCLVAVYPVPVHGGAAGRNLIPQKQNLSFVSLENLEAEYFPANKIVAIKGKIKNVSSITLRGYVTFYLLSTSGSVLSVFDLPVNDHRPFRDGEAVSFDTAVNVNNISGAYQVSVEFTRD